MKIKINNLFSFKKCLIVAIVLIALYIFSFFNILGGKVFVSIENDYCNTQNLILKSTDKNISFDDFDLKLINNISILVKNTPLNTPIFEKSQRYYISISSLCESLNLKIINSNDDILINNFILLNPSKNIVKINNSIYIPRGNLYTINSDTLISLSDVEYLFNLRCNFDFNIKKINLVNAPQLNISTPIKTNGRLALIRLEDFSAGYVFANSENIEKMKILGDLFYTNNIKFHIAWVPRYVNPKNHIDNDLLVIKSLQNVAFVNLLDHLINRGALIGLHGYTHQYSNENSLSGTELSKNANFSEKDTRAIIENSLDTAAALNIPVSFFESPHYKATKNQKNILEEYFKYLYEPFSLSKYFTLKHTNSNNIYIPTPLSYVRDLDPSNIIRGLNIKNNAGALMSFFYHPTKELDFIELKYTDEELTFSYSDQSPMQKIIKSLRDCGYITGHITEIK